MKKILASLRSFWVSLIIFIKEPQKIKILGQLTKGVTIFVIINSLIKILEYQVTRYYEPINAIILMFIMSLIIRSIMIVIYDIVKKDWLLIEHLKERLSNKQEVSLSSSTTKKIIKFKKFGDNIVTIILIFTDPVATVLYKRSGHHLWNTIPNIKILILFVTSTIICTATFASGIYSITEIGNRFWVEINVLLIMFNLII